MTINDPLYLVICFCRLCCSMCLQLLKIVNVSTFVNFVCLSYIASGSWFLYSWILVNCGQLFQIFISYLLRVGIQLKCLELTVDLEVIQGLLIQEIVFQRIFASVNSYLNCNFFSLIYHHRNIIFHFISILLSPFLLQLLFHLLLLVFCDKFLELFLSFDLFFK